MAEEKSKQKLAGVSLGEEEEVLGSGGETCTKERTVGEVAARPLEWDGMGMRNVEGRDCRHGLVGDAGCSCLSASAMQLNHCVKAAINLPVALFTTASGIPPIPFRSDAAPEAAEEVKAPSGNGARARSAEDVMPTLRAEVALRHMHSSNCRLAGGNVMDI
jgi:hypothetical protein